MRARRLTSARRGTLVNVSVSRVKRLAIIKGSAAFLAPLIGMMPFRRSPPTMRMRSMAITPLARPCPLRADLSPRMLAGPNLPHGEPASCQLTPLGLALSPFIARPGRGRSRTGLSLAFQEVGAKFLLKPDTACRRGAVPLALAILVLPAHQPLPGHQPRPTWFISCPYSGPIGQAAMGLNACRRKPAMAGSARAQRGSRFGLP